MNVQKALFKKVIKLMQSNSELLQYRHCSIHKNGKKSVTRVTVPSYIKECEGIHKSDNLCKTL